ncbi:phosphatase PAP2 family protein [Roseimaritima ulvae]|nr:phosphatase PAP2 family protein [Roseimaritima ulvae]
MDSSWQPPLLACDVDDSGIVEPIDVLFVINRLNRFGPEALPDREVGSTEPYFDTDGDGWVMPLDALLVINLLNRRTPSPLLTAGVAVESDPNGNAVIVGDSGGVSGQTGPLSVVSLQVSAGGSIEQYSTQADALGRFSVDVPLELGRNEIEVSVRNALGYERIRRLSMVRGDILQDWNAAALNVVREWSTTSDDPYQGRIVTSAPPQVARNLAMIHGAMFDTLNSFAGDYHSYLPSQSPPSDAVPVAAAAAAAHQVASTLYSESDELAVWDASLHESLRGFGDADLTGSLNFGRSIGNAFLEARREDGADTTGSHTAGDAPGDWERTAPDFLPPLLPAWADVTPFALESANQFRPAAPPSLDSQQYADSVDEVMRIGGYSSTERTADQTEIAIFWADGGGTYTPPGHWNQIASETISAQQLGLLESARTFALVNYALADAGIASWDAKYGYDFWRPIDAIRYAETDGNASTVTVENWLPLVATPPFPTYTSGHSTFSGAAAEVLTGLFGDNFAFSSEIDRRPSAAQKPLAEDRIVTRHFTSFWHAAEEAGISRIYGGIHFDFDNTAGLESGRGVGQWVATRLLQPKAS